MTKLNFSRRELIHTVPDREKRKKIVIASESLPKKISHGKIHEDGFFPTTRKGDNPVLRASNKTRARRGQR
jgi:hypothetical protein